MEALTKTLNSLSTGDTKYRLNNLQPFTVSLSSFLTTTSSPPSGFLGPLVNLTSKTLADNNANVTLMALALLETIATSYDSREMSPYYTSLSNDLTAGVYPEAKSSVRTKTLQVVSYVFRRIVEDDTHDSVVGLGNFFDGCVKKTFAEKNWRVRLMGLQVFESIAAMGNILPCLTARTKAHTRGRVGTKAASSSAPALNDAIASSIGLLNDRREEVREQAISTTIACYRHNKQQLRRAMKKATIQTSIVSSLEMKFAEIDVAEVDAEADLDAADTDEYKNNHHEKNTHNDHPYSNSHSHNNGNPDGYHDDDDRGDQSAPHHKSSPTANSVASSATATSASTHNTHTTHNTATSTKEKDDPSPITVYTERELKTHFSSMSAALKNTASDFWADRCEALVTLQRLVLGGAYNNYPRIFMDGLKSLPINEQIRDLRSQVTGQACKMIVSLARILKDSASSLIEIYLPDLLYLAISGVRLMAQQSFSCLGKVMEAATNGYPKLLPALMSNALEKKHHHAHKRACLHALHYAYKLWGVGVLEKHTPIMLKVLKNCLLDKDPAVREEARMCYWSFHSQFSVEAEEFFYECDAANQRSLNREQKNFETKWAGSNAASASTAAPVSTTTTTSRTAMAAPERVASKQPQKQQPQKQQPQKHQPQKQQPQKQQQSQQPQQSQTPLQPPQQQPSTPKKVTIHSLDELLSMSTSKHWATREECFQQLILHLETPNSNICSTLLSNSQFANLLSTHIDDPHYKVSLAALQTTINAIKLTTFAEHLGSHLQQIIPAMLNQLISSKSSQRKLGNEGLNFVRTVYNANSITGVLVSKLMEVSDRVKPALLELLTALIPTSGEYFGVSSNMRSVLQRLASLLLIRPSLGQTLINSVGLVFETLYHLDSTDVINGISLLPSEPQGVLKKLLVAKNLCVDIDYKIANRGSPAVPPSQTATAAQTPPPPPLSKGSDYHTPDNDQSSINNQNNPPNTANTTPNMTSVSTTSKPTDPVLRYMVRPPLSEEKSQRDWMRETPLILNNLSINSSVQDKYAGMQDMVQLARQQSVPEVWQKFFGQILLSLLEGIGTGAHPGANGGASPTTEFLDRDESAVKHLYLQGIRALLKYQPHNFLDFIEIVVDRLLLCSRDSTYEIVHTAEKALENLATALDSTRCLKVMTPYLSRTDDDTIVLSCMRTIRFVLRRCSSPTLTDALPLLLPSLVSSINSASVDLRKAVVFALVEIYFVMGDKLFPYLGDLTPAQLKLVTIYVERQKKNQGGTAGNTATNKESPNVR